MAKTPEEKAAEKAAKDAAKAEAKAAAEAAKAAGATPPADPAAPTPPAPEAPKAKKDEKLPAANPEGKYTIVEVAPGQFRVAAPIGGWATAVAPGSDGWTVEKLRKTVLRWNKKVEKRKLVKPVKHITPENVDEV